MHRSPIGSMGGGDGPTTLLAQSPFTTTWVITAIVLAVAALVVLVAIWLWKKNR